MKHWYLGCILLICFASLRMAYSLVEEYPFHPEQDIAGTQSGEMLIKTGIFQIGEEQYDADYCTMVGYRGYDGSVFNVQRPLRLYRLRVIRSQVRT